MTFSEGLVFSVDETDPAFESLFCDSVFGAVGFVPFEIASLDESEFKGLFLEES